MKSPKKSLGQNYLIDKNIIKKIISQVEVNNKNIIEIGPGKGALTDEILLHNPKSLQIIEKDFNLSKNLEKKYFKQGNLVIFNQDILKFNLEKICKKNSIIFGNLPYNISSQILVKILRFRKWPPNVTDFVLMFQKELGEKIIGKFLTPSYGRLSILTDLKLKVLNKFKVSNNSFFPKPKVTSMVLHFQPKKKAFFKIKNISNLEKVTNILFSNRRKMINKNIKKILTDEEIKKIPNLEVNLRPTELKPNIFYKITELFEKN